MDVSRADGGLGEKTGQAAGGMAEVGSVSGEPLPSDAVCQFSALLGLKVW